MDDFRASVVVDAAADLVFDFLADASNVSRYAAPVLDVQAVRTRTIQVRAQLDGSVAETAVWRRADRTAMRLTWGAEQTDAVHGEFRITPIGSDGSATMLSVVSVQVHAPNADHVMVQDALDETVRRIKQLTERAAWQVGRVQPSEPVERSRKASSTEA